VNSILCEIFLKSNSLVLDYTPEGYII